MSLSNYPPGVTGREPQLTGEWPCAACGTTLPEEVDGEPFEGDECPGGCYDEGDDLLDRQRDERAEGVCEREW